MPQAVLLGTGNQAKQERLAWLLEGLGLEIVTPAQIFLAAPELEEEGDNLGRARELLSRMAHLDEAARRAYWVEALALADRARLLHTLEAQSGEGIIAQEVDECLVRNGFWVGAVWYFPQMGKRYAELDDIELRRVGDHLEQP